jgi:hypothetical protein
MTGGLVIQGYRVNSAGTNIDPTEVETTPASVRIRIAGFESLNAMQDVLDVMLAEIANFPAPRGFSSKATNPARIICFRRVCIVLNFSESSTK